jgi:CDGSH-type Zn-finger protein
MWIASTSWRACWREVPSKASVASKRRRWTARVVKHDLTGPYKLEKGGDTIWICACGLSKNKPACDGSHKKTRDEEPGALYAHAEDRS